MTGNSAWKAVKVCGPPAARLELVAGFVEWSVATRTGVDTLFRVVLVKLARARRLSALFPEDPELLWYMG